jgi:Poly(ADP-ribose) polymerase catalytic domain
LYMYYIYIPEVNLNWVFFFHPATLFGQGVYFARDFAYSARPTYSPPDPRTGHKYVFQSMVLTGQFTVGTPDMIEPPIRAGNVRYDSVTNNINDPQIFVVFKDTYSYPEYLVTFK